MITVTEPAIISVELCGRMTRFAVNCSWAVNWVMLIIKIVAFVMSLSKAVAAAMADSIVDLLSQAVLSLSDRFV
jgi:divalent metal cation (Fe/Co/Zn/Cd) transporter